MGKPCMVKSAADLDGIRARLSETAEHARQALTAALQDPHPLRLLKFEQLGCDPLDINDAQNLAEQIDQQATYEVAVDALAQLMKKHPGKEWTFAPGAHGAGHDLLSADGEIAAEVFAAVRPTNNRKLSADVKKIAFQG